ncbi:hypothetical protein FHR32_005161 [Streptosporangium album]|uniref:Uncharacterized protein n=1 Tax=Streptosporangium album TaxID=47479 RepID=A0A7W7WC16_9ACTN|nr:hypothetical protein [Streptosporangium album]MBB4940784.1 hypothetical protein [Streptosporangium album]
MRTVYVITEARHPLRQRARNALATLIMWVLVALAVVGHTIALLAGAVDALITAAIGTRRIGYISGQLRDAVRETWKEDL